MKRLLANLRIERYYASLPFKTSPIDSEKSFIWRRELIEPGKLTDKTLCKYGCELYSRYDRTYITLNEDIVALFQKGARDDEIISFRKIWYYGWGPGFPTEDVHFSLKNLAIVFLMLFCFPILWLGDKYCVNARYKLLAKYEILP